MSFPALPKGFIFTSPDQTIHRLTRRLENGEVITLGLFDPPIPNAKAGDPIPAWISHPIVDFVNSAQERNAVRVALAKEIVAEMLDEADPYLNDSRTIELESLLNDMEYPV